MLSIKVVGLVVIMLGLAHVAYAGEAAARTEGSSEVPAVTQESQSDGEGIVEPDAITLPNHPISEALKDVIRLVQAHVSEDAVIAYIESRPHDYQLTVNDIIYLDDVGVPISVISAMLQQSTSGEVAEPEEHQQEVEEPAPEMRPEHDDEASRFYDHLSPYGRWLQIEDYGWCWQPTVVTIHTSWRPYFDRGRWLYTDYGWYWHSDFSWGAITFHYGRWLDHHRHGWVWAPGTVWAPAWVTWRLHRSYCGWAPLPPYAYYRPHYGFYYKHRRVSTRFHFGLKAHHYVFVPLRHFHHHDFHRHALRHHHAQVIFKDSRIVNNIIVGNDNRLIQKGIGLTPIKQGGSGAIRRVNVRDIPNRGTTVRPAPSPQRGSRVVVTTRPATAPPKPKEAIRPSRSGQGLSARPAPDRSPARQVPSRGRTESSRQRQQSSSVEPQRFQLPDRVATPQAPRLPLTPPVTPPARRSQNFVDEPRSIDRPSARTTLRLNDPSSPTRRIIIQHDRREPGLTVNRAAPAIRESSPSRSMRAPSTASRPSISPRRPARSETPTMRRAPGIVRQASPARSPSGRSSTPRAVTKSPQRGASPSRSR